MKEALGLQELVHVISKGGIGAVRALQSALDFEQAITEIQSRAGQPSENLYEVSQQLREMTIEDARGYK